MTLPPIPLWYCTTCTIYFVRLRTWTGYSHHFVEHRAGGYGTPIKALSGRIAVAHKAGDLCPGVAALVTEGPELAAYLLGGPNGVFHMGRKIN